MRTHTVDLKTLPEPNVPVSFTCVVEGRQLGNLSKEGPRNIGQRTKEEVVNGIRKELLSPVSVHITAVCLEDNT